MMHPLNGIALILIATKMAEAFLPLYNQCNHSIKHQNSVCISPKMRLESESAENDTFHAPPNFQDFGKCLEEMSLPLTSQESIFRDVQKAGFTSSSELYAFGQDFEHRPEVLSTILQDDFGFSTLISHQVRAALMRLIDMRNHERGVETNDKSQESDPSIKKVTSSVEDFALESALGIGKLEEENSKEKSKKPLFKSVVVNPKAKQRYDANVSTSQTSNKVGHAYGLPSDLKDLYPKVSQELNEFMVFMTQPSASLQESPIRKATANVYLRHARLFLGWWLNYGGEDAKTSSQMDKDDMLSIFTIIPTNEAASAQPIIDFILWLRKYRDISDSYEANMLRGLTKFLKFRFAGESRADPTYGDKSFQDIPAVRELRKLHRDANKRQTLSPRSSDEEKKWLSWDEYLVVVRALKEDLEGDISTFESKIKKRAEIPKTYSSTQRRIASKFQAYLILAFFSCIPDRQRTFRELEIGRTLLRDDSIGCWTIKHGPDDYKTGKTYGDRPPLVLAPELTTTIDDYLDRWRNCLRPRGNHFFVQPRTGKAFTQDSVYSIVARSCYKYAGKKTNPHLLRDMIVTHVRDSDASEKELEALALYMGHSISMQRTSYDRRTMQQKVAPAVDLLRAINSQK